MNNSSKIFFSLLYKTLKINVFINSAKSFYQKYKNQTIYTFFVFIFAFYYSKRREECVLFYSDV